MSTELPERLLQAVVSALPIDPDTNREMVVGYEVVTPTADERASEPALPGSYSIPIYGDAMVIAAKTTVALLRVLGSVGGRDLGDQFRSLADRVQDAADREVADSLIPATPEKT